jgi:hypothetical protein
MLFLLGLLLRAAEALNGLLDLSLGFENLLDVLLVLALSLDLFHQKFILSDGLFEIFLDLFLHALHLQFILFVQTLGFALRLSRRSGSRRRPGSRKEGLEEIPNAA